jgi:glycosyltransferase involved in cell wall biosynthesis
VGRGAFAFMLQALRILFLTPELPYPPRGGGTIKSATLLDYLKGRHDVDLVCLRRSGPVEPSLIDGFGTVVTADVRGKRSPANLLRSYAARIPLSILRNRSERFAELLREHVRRRPPDAIFADSWLTAQYVPADFEGLKTIHQHNAEFVMWEREAAVEANPLRRALVRREAERVRRYEGSILSAFDVVFAVSEPDRAALRGLVTDPPRMELLPNVPEPGLLERPDLSPHDSEQVILYLGTLSWQPNARGLRHFLGQVFPQVRERLPRVRLIVAGRGAPPSLARLARRTSGVEMIGAFDHPEPLYRRARAFIEVAHGGSGTRVKVLNALARGLPVVTTPEGAEGLGIRSGEQALVGSSAPAIVHALMQVLTDDDTWMALARGGRRFVRERYVPEIAYSALDQVFVGA